MRVPSLPATFKLERDAYGRANGGGKSVGPRQILNKNLLAGLGRTIAGRELLSLPNPAASSRQPLPVVIPNGPDRAEVIGASRSEFF